MSFYDGLKEIFNIDTLEPYYRLIVLNDNNICIEGIKKIIDFSNTEVIFDNTLNSRIRLCGKDFVIVRLEKNEIYLKGELSAIEYI